MSITIKELFPSDPISEAIEKINFNFDQLLLAGGGPPGNIGPTGGPGQIGPQGIRGDHWFTGPTYGGLTADHDGSSPLRVKDSFLDPNGDVWNYFDILGSTGWTYSGINLKGPAGSVGATGGSFEWSLYLGASGNAISGPTQHYGPALGPTTVDNNNLNFIAPLGATKNGLLLGDPDWFYNKLVNWNNITQFSGVPPAGPYIEGTPRLTIIQREVDDFGINGIQIGAYGLTGATYPIGSISSLYSGSPVPSGSTVNAYDFFSIGFGVDSSFNRELIPGGVAYASHVAGIRTFTRDISIIAGNSSFPGGSLASIRMKSNRFTIQDHTSNRWISSGIRVNSSLSYIAQNLIEINSSPGTGATYGGWLNLQGYTGGSSNPVIIGWVRNDAVLPSLADSSLIISKGINSASTQSSSISFIDPNQQTNTNDVVGKIIPVQNTLRNSTIAKSIIIATQGVSITPAQATLNAEHQARFPFHVNQIGATIGTSSWGWPNGSTAWASIAKGGFAGWLAGFDKADYDSLNDWPNKSNARGLGIGYVKNPTATNDAKEIILQTYFVGNWEATQDFGSRGTQTVTYNNPTSNPSTLRNSPHLYTQLGSQNSNGNLAIGLGPTGDNIHPWSKLTVNGTIRIGDYSIGGTGIFEFDKGNSMAPGGILSGGKIIRGIIPGATQGTWYATAGLTAGQVLTMFEGSTGTTSGGGTGIGISSLGWIMADNFLAKTGNNNLLTSYALADGKSGMRLGSTAGDSYLVSSANPTFSSINSNTPTIENLRFSITGDFGATSSGVQTRGVHADLPLYLTTEDIIGASSLSSGILGIIPGSGDYGDSPPNTKSWRYIAHTIPTNRSVIYFDLSAQSSSRIEFTNNTYSNKNTQSTVSSSWISGDANFSSASSSLGGWYGRRFFLQPGAYDGQLVTLIFGAVNSNNRFIIFNEGPLPGTSPGATSITIPDRHVFAASPRDDWNLASTSPFAGSPYPFPLGATMNSFATTPGVTAIGASAISSNNWTRLQAENGNYYDELGFFVVKSWRTITLRWIKIRSSFSGADNYAWVEVSREYLSTKSSKEITISGGEA